MADFKTALDALAGGKLELDALVKQLDKLLKENPRFAVRLLAQLDEAHEQARLNDKSYADLKRQINEFRREHSNETEAATLADPDATVFARDDENQAGDDDDKTFQAQFGDSEDSTEMKSVSGIDTEDATVRKGIDSEDATEIKGTGTSTEDATIRKGIDSEDSTEINQLTQGQDDATRPMPRGDAGMSHSAVDFDLSMDNPDTSPSLNPSTGTGSGWEEPVQQTYSGPGHELGVGDVIKQRFKLLDVLGIGGMGKVFKGIDLLKEEAQDKNPYMAIKLLNEDFKSHPEAFISLQRESSRQQKLAHPNIATVYDFDRIGGRGTPVFITMELMEGQPLNTYIKKVVKKQGGLPFIEAFVIVKQLAAALQYAHERRLVHSDFKPGNAFLCNDGTVKTLDFGIARAVKNPVTGEAEKTLFDPGKLGALTPAYASLEMLEGEEPDTRDDTYALGCVAYELLTGKHPFNKLPANTARENGLVPPAVKGLNKKQNRALRRSVAFKREDRPQTVADFIEEFEGKPTWHKNPFTIAAGVLLVIGIMLINPARDYLHQQKIDGIISEMNTGGNSVIVQKLDEIRTLNQIDQVRITDSAREPIQRYFSGEIARYIDVSANNYNFQTAENILARAEGLYPASLFIQQQRNDIEFNKRQKISDLYQEFIAALDPTLAQENPDSIDGTKQVLDTIRRQIDPQHPLLTDTRPSNAYRLAANLAFENGDMPQALTFVNSGLQNSANDSLLTDLQFKIQSAIRIAELNETLTDAEAQLLSLDAYKQYESQITELARLDSIEESPLLTSLSNNLKPIVDTELKRLLDEGDRNEAQILGDELETLLTSLLLSNELTQIKLAHLEGDERAATIAALVADDKAILASRLSSPDPDNPQWEADVLGSVRELEALKAETPGLTEDLESIQSSLAQIYISRATTTLNANRFDAAESLVIRGLRIAPDLASLNDTRALIANNRAEYEKQLRINGMKDQFQVAVEADNIAQANQIFENLKIELPVDDSYITTQAPRELAESYRRLAERRAESQEYASALQLIEAAVALNPRDTGLQIVFEEYRARVNITELAETFRTARVFTDNERIDLARKVNEVERGTPGEYSNFLSQSESILAQRINQLAQSDENTAAALADMASRIFTDSSVLVDLRTRYQLQPWPERGVADAAIRAGELTRANALLQAGLAGEYATHPDVLQLQRSLEENIQSANEAFQLYLSAKEEAGNEYGRLNTIKRLLFRAQGLWVDNPEYTEAETEIDTLIANAPDNPSRRILQRADENIAAVSGDDLIRAAEQWTPIPSDRACTEDKASYGARARAICYDFVYTGWRGPQMVVIPTGGDIESKFAIGKYEVSVADWSRYCVLTRNCSPVTDRARFDDPITGISLADAQKYTNWLSERTGKTYRLPTAQEWEYAATVGGALDPQTTEFREIKSQLNCRVTLGDRILKGTGTATIKSGRPNRWGIYNFVGNVQEWVQDGSRFVARGGAFSDSINNCDISTIRQHNGNPDDITGFRVILEEIG